jgi:homoserine/homoserine lactone efflux protein
MEFKIWFAYLATDILLSLTPGPAVILVTSQGLKYGATPSYFGTIGISSVELIYFILSAFGLGSLILNAGHLFEYIKVAGALYLLWLGGGMLYHSFKKGAVISYNSEHSQDNVDSFIQGFVTQVGNPNAIIFFVALLPQFLDPSRSILFQFIVYGLTTMITETSILMLYGWLGSRGKKLAGQNRAIKKWQERISGLVLIGICINLFFMKRSAT